MTAAARIRLNSEHHAAHPDMTRQDHSKWAASTFKMPRPLARTSLNDLLKCQEDDTERNPLRKASHCAHSPELEAQLVLWINRCGEMKIPIVTGAAIRQKEEMIRSILLNTATPATAAVFSKLKFSKGWLYRFQQWQGLKSRRTHEEAVWVKTTAIENGRRVLQAAASLYDKEEIYNMDETAYFY
uniref:AlNc14C348G10879 protein n=1 Tax=Albugo laibachii Nc14 TaxID=890382 RepID=F0WXC7_9STRA|nr:AlNc14C348G10879 [Albugo laibachii Nc14]|eukprot:CCA26119.1 AlNc14C348G10879 [Albugo laibachii Nc14]